MDENKDASVSVVFPVHNEVEVIEDVLRNFQNEVISQFRDSEMIVVESGSSDGTKGVLQDLEDEMDFDLRSYKEKRGYSRDLRETLQMASKEKVFYSDTDGTHSPDDFWRLYSYADSYDVITGVRADRDVEIYRKILTVIYNSLVRSLFDVDLRDSNCGFNMMDRKVIDQVVKDTEVIEYGFSTELLLRADSKDFSIKQVEINHKSREYGQDQFRLKILPKAVFTQFRDILELKTELRY